MSGDSDNRNNGGGDNWQARTHVMLKNPLAKPREGGNDCLVIIYARTTSHLGRRFVLTPTEGKCWVGRDTSNSIVIESDTCSRRHAYFELRGESWWVVDNKSTNGTYVNDEPANETQLRRGDHVRVGDTIFKYLAGSDVEAEFMQTIGTIMVTDGLTKAHNRRYFSEQLDKEILRAVRHGRPLSLIMFDLDYFKKINDNYGHLAGDFVLREVAALVRERIPPDVIFARYGGEEFALLLPETDLQSAFAVAEDLRNAVAERAFIYENVRLPVTASLGVAVLQENVRIGDELIKTTDAKLYTAKQSGRNRVVA